MRVPTICQRPVFPQGSNKYKASDEISQGSQVPPRRSWLWISAGRCLAAGRAAPRALATRAGGRTLNLGGRGAEGYGQNTTQEHTEQLSTHTAALLLFVLLCGYADTEAGGEGRAGQKCSTSCEWARPCGLGFSGLRRHWLEHRAPPYLMDICVANEQRRQCET